MPLLRCILALLSCLAFALASHAGTVYVDANAGGANTGANWTDAYTSLETAIAAASGGDEIWVAAGTYTPTTGTNQTISFALKTDVAIYGGFAGTENAVGERNISLHPTILSGEIGVSGTADNSDHVVLASGTTATAILDGFTITAGNGSGGSDQGGGILLTSSATIRNCTFVSNSATYGGGMWISGGTSVVTNCIFRSNTAGYGGGLGINNGGAAFTNCVFSSNTASYYAGAGDFVGNSSFVNCTVVSNTASVTSGGLFANSAATAVRNCIVRGNAPSQVITATVTYSNVQGGYSGTGNIDADPLFASASSGNYRLVAGSPCIDAGDNSAVPGDVTTDLDGNARFIDDPGASDTGAGTPPLVDMGAYERVVAASYPLTVTKSGSGSVTSSPAGINCDPTCAASFDANSTVTLTATASPGAMFLGWSGECSGRGTCSVTLRTAAFVTASFGGVVYVDRDATGANDGSSWADAYVSLQTALTNASSGTGIWVAAGTYKPTSGSDRSISFTLANGVVILGGFSGTETLESERNPTANLTVLSGDIGAAGNADNSYHVVTDGGAGATAMLDGFTITSGNANGASFPDNAGGGLYLTGSPIIENCRVVANVASTGGGGYSTGAVQFRSTAFTSNSATNGGALLVLGAPQFTACSFSFNSATGGGGVSLNTSTATFLGCTFSGNSASQTGGAASASGGAPSWTDCTFHGNTATIHGGALFMQSGTVTNGLFTGNAAQYGGALRNTSGTMTVVNSTFANNTASVSGVVCEDSGTLDLRNSVVWGNSGSSLCAMGGTQNVTYSDVEGGVAGTGNIASNPLFVNALDPGDLRLASGSPCIDAGDNTAVTSGVTTDLAGAARFFDDPSSADTGVGPAPIVDMGAYEFSGSIPGVSLAVAIAGGATGSVVSDVAGIDCPATCTASFDLGTPVTLTATADAGMAFSGWSGDCSGLGPCSVSMTAAHAVTATFSRVLHVNATATGANDGSSWADAYTSLQTALGDATPGAEIWVAGGTYTPGASRASTFQLKNGVSLFGGFDGTESDRLSRFLPDNPTILSGEIGTSAASDNCYHVLTADGTIKAPTVLDGFVITLGYADGSFPSSVGGGLYSQGSPTIRNCWFKDNSAVGGSGYGGAVAAFNATATNEQPTFFDCTFTGNQATYGSAIMIVSSAHLINTSFSGNGTSSAIFLNLPGGAAPTLVNSIVWGNYASINTTGITVSNSIVEGGASGTGNLSADPLFVAPGSGNLRLRGGSPAIDAGRNADVPAGLNLDFDNLARFVDDPATADTGSGTAPLVDMGAHEYQLDSLVVTKAGRGTGTVTSTPNVISCGDTCYAVLTAGTEVALEATPDPGWRFTGWSGACSGIGTCTVTVPSSVTARFGKIWYVNAFASGADDGTSWTSAFPSLQSALGAASNGDEIWVAAATYTPSASDRSQSFGLVSGVGLYGGFNATETDRSARNAALNVTTLSGEINATGNGDNSYHVVKGVGVDAATVLDGFTITGGSANTFSGIDYLGGGIYLESAHAAISNCTISGNFGSRGAGVWVASGTAAIRDCTITANSGDYGGGIGNAGNASFEGLTINANTTTNSGAGIYSNGGAPLIRDCTITSNTTTSPGGGVYTAGSSARILDTRIQGNSAWSGASVFFDTPASSPSLENSILTGNSATIAALATNVAASIVNCTITENSGSAMLNASGSPLVTNSILWGNTPNTISGSALITYSDVQGGYSGAGNVDADPLFVDGGAGNFRLSTPSPGLDAGSNVAAGDLATDYEGKPRRTDASAADTGIGTPPIVDMGAYELYPVTVSAPSPATACAGTGANFSVTASGWGALAFQWRKNTTPLGGETASTLAIPSVSTNDSGSYDVVVTDSLGTSTTSAAATLTVTTAPSISLDPQDATTCAGTQVSFTVTATGSSLTYQWRKGLTPIPDATSATYTIASPTASDAGSYDVVISGACSPSVTSNSATLTVNAVTSISAHPHDATVCANQPVNLGVTATGTNVSYQWRKGASPIAGATSPTYAIASASTSDAGTYDVVVTGSCGTITSDPAILTVNTAPSILTFNPPSGGVGTQVVIGGSGLTGATSVLFNGTPAVSMSVDGDTQITAAVPAGTTTGPITVTKNGCASATSASSFTIIAFGAPSGLVATAISATEVAVTWSPVGGTNHYEIFRGSGIGPFSFVGTSITNTFTDTTASASTTYFYQARAVSTGGSPSAMSNSDVATTVVFTVDSLVLAVQWTELRVAVNAMRAAAGLTAATFTDPSLSGVSIKAIHLQEIRNALDPAVTALGLTPISYEDATIIAGTTVVKTSHLQQIRDRVK